MEHASRENAAQVKVMTLEGVVTVEWYVVAWETVLC